MNMLSMLNSVLSSNCTCFQTQIWLVCTKRPVNEVIFNPSSFSITPSPKNINHSGTGAVCGISVATEPAPCGLPYLQA